MNLLTKKVCKYLAFTYSCLIRNTIIQQIQHNEILVHIINYTINYILLFMYYTCRRDQFKPSTRKSLLP